MLAGMRRASLQAADDASGHSGKIVAQSPPQDAVDVSAMAAPQLAQLVPQITLLQRWQVSARPLLTRIRPWRYEPLHLHLKYQRASCATC